MADEQYADHPHMPLLRLAYSHFRAGDPQTALDRLEPVLMRDETACHPSTVTGLLWGLAGDCYFKVGEAENGFIAYRQAITLDAECGCLAFFARQVARHRRAEDAEFALQCLDVERAVYRAALKKHAGHVLRHSLNLDTLWLRLVVIPLTRWRLHRLATLHRR